MNLQTFTNTIRPIKEKLFRFSLNITGDVAEAEDVVQEVFIKLWDNRNHVSEIKNLDAWCMRVTKNLSIDKLRSAHKRVHALPEGQDFHDSGTNLHKAAELDDAVGRVKQFMEKLPEAQKMVIQFRDVEGMSYQEVADALELSMEQVKVYLHRARKSIREQLIQSESYGL